MGCDIHMVIEHRRSGQWKLVGEPTRDAYGDLRMPEPYRRRNYDVFAILANVRNGHFAPAGYFVPISEPRGVPDDASPLVRKWMLEGDHSHSWVTLRELCEYDWSRTVEKQALIDLEEFRRRHAAGESGEPQEYCGGAWGPNTRVVDNDEALRMLALPSPLAHGQMIYTPAKWIVSYREAAKGFVELLPKWLELGAADDVRLCFWFDS